MKEKKISKIIKDIGENVKSLKDTEDISGIEDAAKSIVLNQKKETLKRRIYKALIYVVVIIIAAVIFRICPSCASFMIKHAPELITLILGG